MMDLYAENIMDHYKNPRFKGSLSKKSVSVTQKEANHSCGDIMEIDLEIHDENLKNIAWRGEGCAISQSAMSILLEEIKNLPVSEILKLKKEDTYKMLGVPISARRSKCATLSLLTLKNAILKYQNKNLLHFVDILE
ncbi:hypothetical protein A2335_04635 [Candidatus Peregrinibacteria bacterium RIFOXYB2_FULL_32_7]|nr:MAG: hypothetical protein A2335_04635 [Candidatus Peregrinibacteria bacterium RIFOXYB2_FULL_32_7]